MSDADAHPDDHAPSAYLLAHIREALASDPRTVELGVEVEVVPAIRTVVLMGRVGSETVRATAGEVAAGEAPGHVIRNDLEVIDLESAPDPPEHLR